MIERHVDPGWPDPGEERLFVDELHLAIVQQIAPSQQAEARDAMRRGVLANAHAAPIHRLDMHRPERLDGLASLVFRQPKTPTPPPFAPLLACQFLLDADSDDVARSFRDHVARCCSDMMSPA
jgi:hypothetical protein